MIWSAKVVMAAAVPTAPAVVAMEAAVAVVERAMADAELNAAVTAPVVPAVTAPAAVAVATAVAPVATLESNAEIKPKKNMVISFKIKIAVVSLF
jgi:hypothetical protein